MSKIERPIVVFAYDFDGTLAPDYMQNHAFIPDELAMKHPDFWDQVKALAKAQRGDEIHAYMHLMLEYAKKRDLDLSLSEWQSRGAKLPLFPGVEEWFDRQNGRAAELEIDLRHFIISSGNREMIEGSTIAQHMERIYASAFMFDESQKAIGVALAVNYTNKTQFLFRINKWTLDEWDNTSINKPIPLDDRPVPFNRMVFFGDGETDVPIMRLVTDQGGYAVAVYDPSSASSRKAALDLRDAERARFAGPADFSEGGSLDEQAGGMLAEMSARAHVKNLVRWPDEE